jgi:hypothetical protein
VTSQMSAITPRDVKSKPSKKLLGMIDSYVVSVKSTLKKLIANVKERDKIFEQGRKDGLTDIEIGDLLRIKLRPVLSDRQIRRYLPDTAKRQQMVRFLSQDLEPRLELADRPKGTPVPISGHMSTNPEQEPVTPVAAVAVTAEAEPEVIYQVPPESLAALQQQEQEQQQQQSEPKMRVIIDETNLKLVPNYDIDNLEQYDKPYLIEIVKMQYKLLEKVEHIHPETETEPKQVKSKRGSDRR